MRIKSTLLDRTRRRLRSLPGLTIYSLGVYVFLFLPISMIVLFSFNNSQSGTFPITGLSLNWYGKVFADPLIMAAAKRSTIVALATSLISGVLGTLCAMGLARYKFRLKGVVWILLLTPMILPGLILGISLLTYFFTLGIRLSLTTVIISHSVWAVPYVVFIVYARLQDFDLSVEEAACDLGANTWQVFHSVTFPMIASSILSAMMIIFAWSFDDFLVTFFTIGSQPTLPIIIWGMLRKIINPTLHAIATLILVVSMSLLFAARRIGNMEIDF